MLKDSAATEYAGIANESVHVPPSAATGRQQEAFSRRAALGLLAGASPLATNLQAASAALATATAPNALCFARKARSRPAAFARSILARVSSAGLGVGGGRGSRHCVRKLTRS